MAMSTNVELQGVVVSPLESMHIERINSSLSSDTTWYELIKRDHHQIYEYLLFLGAFFPKRRGYRYFFTLILAATYIVALSNFIYLGIMILMGRVREVYPGLVRVSSKSENSLHEVSAALFFCCIICCLQIGVCMYVNRQMEYRIFNLRALSRHIDFEGIQIDTSLIYDETLKTCKLFFSVSNFLVLYIFCVKLVYTGYDLTLTLYETLGYIPVSFGLTSALFFLLFDVKYTQQLILACVRLVGTDAGLTLAQFRKAQSMIEDNYSFLSRSYLLLIINAVLNAIGILIFLIFVDPFSDGITSAIVFSLAAFAWFGRELIFLLVALFEICKVNEYNILLLDTLQMNDDLLLKGDGELILLLSIRRPLAFKLGDYIVTRQKLLFQILLFALSSITVFVYGVVKNLV